MDGPWIPRYRRIQVAAAMTVCGVCGREKETYLGEEKTAYIYRDSPLKPFHSNSKLLNRKPLKPTQTILYQTTLYLHELYNNVCAGRSQQIAFPTGSTLNTVWVLPRENLVNKQCGDVRSVQHSVHCTCGDTLCITQCYCPE